MAWRPRASPLNISSHDREEDLTKNETGLPSSSEGGSVTVTLRKEAQPEEPAGTDFSILP